MIDGDFERVWLGLFRGTQQCLNSSLQRKIISTILEMKSNAPTEIVAIASNLRLILVGFIQKGLSLSVTLQAYRLQIELSQRIVLGVG
ncbi:hypothetical protein NZK35_07920 [Stieleria sp. ICT_E10.1]|uniref:hypothetical protein n=1 Tax=Stieleria sedimenti TaxID=2976331 RepID=UPI002180320A|nr:hypothetical protein [Stieleria sedimenti]MCS7466567.1 hypothetical protein [Stieleria sedimenti]